MPLPQYLGTTPTHRFNAETGLFEAFLVGAFSFVITPNVYVSNYLAIVDAMHEFEMHQRKIAAGTLPGIVVPLRVSG